MVVFLLSFAALLIFTSVYGFFELKMLTVKKYKIDDDRVPFVLKGKKIALLSDLHGIYHGKDNIRLFRMLKAEKPDYIVIAGDLINGRDSSELKYAFRFIRRIGKFKCPVLYTFGNHEEKLKDKDLKAYRRLRRYAARKCILLNNKAYRLDGNNEVAFIGLNLPLWMYHGHDGNNLIKRWTDRITEVSGSKDCYKILIAHDPEHAEQYEKSGYDVCLSGHVHGGIVYLPHLGGIISPRFQVFNKKAKGFHRSGNMKMIISGGIGWHDIPLRLFNRPEIVIIEF